ncbi:MAG: alpha/beta fold hydrolase, partial [Ktedonobacterales bacterium]
MPVGSKYSADRVGDWGVPAAAPGGAYDTAQLKLADGTALYYRYWQAPDLAAPVLVILHGLGAHTGWFIDLGNELNARGLSVYMDDHRGFGRSEGARGHVRRGTVYLDDIDHLLREVRRRHPDAPLFLCGHSMGAIFAVLTAAADATTRRNRLSGLILANPWIRDTSKPTLRLAWAVYGRGAFGSARPIQGAGGPEAMTTNPEATSMLLADSQWVRAETGSFFYQILKLRGRVLKAARAVRVPALVIQSEQDLAVVP